MEKYIGRIVTIIYQDRSGAFTKRRIRVLAVDGNKVKAHCYTAGAPRLFVAERIMAIEAVRVS
ncbi:hypothetical protein D3C76_1778580 [compost metagenome]